jgi:AhpD family alkylhydroperoxidase
MPTIGATDARLSFESFQQIVPDAVTALRTVGKAVAGSGLEPELLELVKLRASQLNACAFCIQFHLNDARKLGIAPAKLDLLAAWPDAGIYTPRELAALGWTEAVTLLSENSIDNSIFADTRSHFSVEEIAFLTSAIGQINFWNRIAVAFRFTPPIPNATA